MPEALSVVSPLDAVYDHRSKPHQCGLDSSNPKIKAPGQSKLPRTKLTHQHPRHQTG